MILAAVLVLAGVICHLLGREEAFTVHGLMRDDFDLSAMRLYLLFASLRAALLGAAIMRLFQLYG